LTFKLNPSLKKYLMISNEVIHLDKLSITTIYPISIYIEAL